MRGKKCKILPSISNLQMDIIIGSLLGDGHLKKLKSENSNSHFSKSQAVFKKEYLDWHFEILKEYSSGVKPCFSKNKISNKNSNKKLIHEKTKKRLSSYAYRTFNNEKLTEIRNIWYPKGKKIIPTNLKLNHQIIAIWYFDDGSNDHKSRAASICTNSFTLKEVKFLSKLLNDFDLYPTINIRKSRDGKKNQPILKFNGDSYDKLINIVKPYMLWKCFEYKIKHREAKKNWSRNLKINEEQAKKIIALKKLNITTKEISTMFGLHKNTINQIASGRSWKNLDR